MVTTSSSAIAERSRCRVGQFWPKVEDDILQTIYASIFNHCDVIGLQSYRIWWNKTKLRLLRRSRSFKVTDVGTNRKIVCNFLLMINSNWHPISYHRRLLFKFWTLCVSETPWGLMINVYHSSWTHWKAHGGLPVNVNWTFSLDVTAEALRAKIDWKSAFCTKMGQNLSNFHVEGDIPHQSFSHASMHTLQLCCWQFSRIKPL